MSLPSLTGTFFCGSAGVTDIVQNYYADYAGYFTPKPQNYNTIPLRKSITLLYIVVPYCMFKMSVRHDRDGAVI